MNTLTAQQIKEQMTGTPWQKNGLSIENADWWITDVEHPSFTDATQEANAAAITLSVNSTFGLGYDPSKMDAMYRMVKALMRCVGDDSISASTHKEAQELLNSAKLTPCK